MLCKQRRFEYNENNFKKKTQIKVLKLIKRTNIDQSQHPLSVLLQSIIEANIYQFTL